MHWKNPRHRVGGGGWSMKAYQNFLTSLLSSILLCLVHFYDNSVSYLIVLIVLPYLKCLHKISNKEIFFPDKYIPLGMQLGGK